MGNGLEGALGDTLTLSAVVTDPNGDAAPGGTDIDGAGEKLLAGVDVTFFYDLDNNGRPDASESLGTSPTNDAGVASLSFLLDPQFVRAGTYETGIHAEFAGDARYTVARASARLIVHPAAIDVSRTIIEAVPDNIPADGFSKSTLRARLVDTFNNPLDETSDEHTVVFTTDLGVLQKHVVRDLLDGTYTQDLQSQRKTGTASVKVIVDDVEGPVHTVEITGNTGCHCASAELAPLGCALAALLRRRRR